MKKCIYILVICSVLIAAVLMVGGCGYDVEAMGSVTAELAEQTESAPPEILEPPHVVLEPEAHEPLIQEPPEPLNPPDELLFVPPIDPTGVWGDALEEYLAQFLSLFHNGYTENGQAIDGNQRWYHVRWTHDYHVRWTHSSRYIVRRGFVHSSFISFMTSGLTMDEIRELPPNR